MPPDTPLKGNEPILQGGKVKGYVRRAGDGQTTSWLILLSLFVHSLKLFCFLGFTVGKVLAFGYAEGCDNSREDWELQVITLSHGYHLST